MTPLSPQKWRVLEFLAVQPRPMCAHPITIGNPRTWWSLCRSGHVRHQAIRWRGTRIVRCDGFKIAAKGLRALRSTQRVGLI